MQQTNTRPSINRGTHPTSHDYQDLADFRHALRVFLRFSEEQARAAGITPQQHMLLLAVRGHASYPCVTVGDVAESLQVKHHSASRLIDRSVQRGLLHRVEDPHDRRRALVSLTEHGESLLARLSTATTRELSALEGDIFRESFREALRALGNGQTAQPEPG